MLSFAVKLGSAVALGAVVLCACGPGAEATTRNPSTAAVTDTSTVHFAIAGMTCGSCATTARLALQRVAGVYQATVSYDSASALVRYDPARTSPEVLVTRLQEMTGYQAQRVE